MAYNIDNEQVELGKWEKNSRGEYIAVQSVTPKKDPSKMSIDIRNMYTDAEGQIRPTQKGVRFSAELAVDVIKSILSVLTDDEVESIRAACEAKLDEAFDIGDDDDDIGV